MAKPLLYQAPMFPSPLNIKSIVPLLGLIQTAFTPHGLRRGVATCRFSLYLCNDRTQEHGRWGHQRTARQHIDEAMAESGVGNLALAAFVRIPRGARMLLVFLQHQLQYSSIHSVT